LDAGIIACLQRRYKKRRLPLVLRAFSEKERRLLKASAAVAAMAAAAAA